MKKIIFIVIIFSLSLTLSAADFIGELDIYVGHNIDLDAFIVKDSAISDSKNVHWSSDDSSIASVDPNGVVTAKRYGRTFISVSDVKSGGKSVIIFVSVNNLIHSISFEKSEVTVISGDYISPDFTIKLVDEKIKLYDKGVKYKSLNEKIIKIENNRFLALKSGKTRVYVYTSDGNKSDYIDVIVKDKYQSIEINNIVDESEFFVGQEFQTEVVDSDGKIIESGIEYEVSRAGFLELSANGYIKFLKPGEINLKVSSKSGKYDYKKINIISLIKDVIISEKNVVLDKVGDNKILYAELIRTKENIKPIVDGVIWHSSNPSVVSVDNGVLLAKSDGISRISVTTQDGLFKDYCSVTVGKGNKSVTRKNSYVKSIDISVFEKKYSISEEIPLEISFEPSNATQNKLTFESNIGNGSQVFLRGEQYYIKPSESGLYKLTVISESGIKKTVEFFVENRLKSISLDHKMINKINNRYNVFYGEPVDIKVVFDQVENKENFDNEFLVSTLNNRVKISNVTNDGFTFIGDSVGDEIIIVKSKYSNRQTYLKVNVSYLTTAISLSPISQAKIGESFIPSIEYKIVENEKYVFEPFDNRYKLSIEASFIPKEYIYGEIKYEIDSIRKLKEIKNQSSNNSAIFEKEILARESRKRKFESTLKNVVNGYSRISNTSHLTDRSGKSIRVASVANNSIVGLFKGSVIYSVTTHDGNRKASGKLYFDSEINDFIIKSDDEIISSSEKNIEKDINIERMKNTNDKINIRYANSVGFDIPSKEMMNFILSIESKVEVSDSLKHEYNRIVSKEEFYTLLIDIIKSKSDYKTKKVFTSIYLDDHTGIYNEAYNLGLLSRTSDRKIYPKEKISYSEFQEGVNKLKRVLDIKSKMIIVNDSFYKEINLNSNYPNYYLGKFKRNDQLNLEEMLYLFDQLLNK